MSDGWDDVGTWVVYSNDSGESTEDMRFATRKEAKAWIHSRTFPWEFGYRYEP
jgi:hypothetical protein